MHNTDYRTLIARLERQNAVAPERYWFKTIVLALVAVAYPLVLLLAGLSGWVSGVVSLLLGVWGRSAVELGAGALCAGLLWPLLQRAPQARQGRRLSKREAPKLYDLVNKIRAKVSGPCIKAIYISGEFELSVRQTPRWGLLGGYRNTLLIGLPVLQLLSRKEVAALIGHEYEHLTGHQGTISAWIYRLRKNWSLAASTEQRSAWGRLAWAPIRAYFPFFNAFSFMMARQSEWQADRLGARVVGKRLMADALISHELGKRFLEEQFWPNLWLQARYADRPKFPPHMFMRTAMMANFSEASGNASLSLALKTPSNFDVPLPCLNDRLMALDQRPELPPQSTHSAAQVLLGDSLPALIKEFDERWFELNAQTWASHRNRLQQATRLVEELQIRSPAQLPAAEQYRYGLALLDLGHRKEALPILQLAADHPQGSAQAAMAAARLLHDLGDEAAIHYLELAMRKDADMLPEAASQAADFYLARGDKDRACNYWQRLPAQAA